MKLLYPLIILFAFSFAEQKTFIREYTYQASDYDSKVTARVNALNQVSELLLREVGVYIEKLYKFYQNNLGKEEKTEHGKWVYYNDNGDVTKEVIYENGKIIDTKHF